MLSLIITDMTLMFESYVEPILLYNRENGRYDEFLQTNSSIDAFWTM